MVSAYIGNYPARVLFTLVDLGSIMKSASISEFPAKSALLSIDKSIADSSAGCATGGAIVPVGRRPISLNRCFLGVCVWSLSGANFVVLRTFCVGGVLAFCCLARHWWCL